MIKFTYLKCPLNKYTFKPQKIRAWLESRCKGKVLNLFAGQTKLNVDEIRNDVNPEMSANYHKDAFEFVYSCVVDGSKFDTIILDPPYSLRKSMEKYNGKIVSKFTKILNMLPYILNNNGIIITFGYRSVIMGKNRGFQQKEVCLISHSGAQHDTIAVIEEKVEKRK